MESTRLIEVGTELPPVSKQVTQEKINLFETCGILHGASIHTDPEIAAHSLGTTYPIASGRMSIAYATEALRKFFSPDVFNHTGTLNLKFLRPVKGGDTISVKGLVREKLGRRRRRRRGGGGGGGEEEEEEEGTRVTVDVWCENQNGDKTAVGTASVVVPR